MPTLSDIYPHLWEAHGDEFAALDRSLGPRSWTYLLEVARASGVGPQSIVADIGCGRGNHCRELSRQFGCQVIGIDLILKPLIDAMLAESFTSEIQLVQGTIDQLPIRTESVDFIWCRDMLVHVRDLQSAASECSRILQKSGKMLAWVTYETELMERREAERLYAPLGVEPDSMLQQNVEACFESAGFYIAHSENLGAELIEFYEENDGRASRELMRIARLTRMRTRWLAEWGKVKYETAHALYHWVVYHLLGKLSSGLYVLEKRKSSSLAETQKGPTLSGRPVLFLD